MTENLPANVEPKAVAAAMKAWTPEQIQLIKDTVAKGSTDNEFQLFIYTAKKTGLDPLGRQIHAVKRWNSALGRESMAIQTAIDGYRLIAERTKRYAPGREPTYQEKEGKLYAATSYIKKYAQKEWHEVAATAYWDEYVQTKKDGTPNHMWAKMPHLMLAKVAEALALRKAFPAEMAGVYTNEEMDQADSETIQAPKRAAPTPAAMPERVEPIATDATVVPATEPETAELKVSKVEPILVGKGQGYRYEIATVPDRGVLHTTNKGFAVALKNAMETGEPINIYWRLEDGKQNITALT